MFVLMLSWQIGQPLQAATLYWDADAAASGNTSSTGAGLGGTGTWNTSSFNWWNSTTLTDQAWINANNDLALFTNAAGPFTVTLGSAITAGSLRFDVDGYTIAGGGNALTLAGVAPTVSVTNAATLATITSSLTLSGGAYFGGAGNLAINTGVISDGGSGFGFTKFGSGTLTLGGANTFSGPVVLNGGTTVITAANNLGNNSLPSNTLTFAGGTLQAGGTFNLGASRSVSIGLGGGTIDVTGANNLTVDGLLSAIGISGTATAAGTASLVKTDTGTLTLTNTGNGAVLVNTIVNGGTVSFGAATALGGGYIGLNGGTLLNTASTSTAAAQVISLGSSSGGVVGLGGTIAVAAGQTLTDVSAINGPGSLTVGISGSTGTLKLNVASTYAGSTTVSFGTLQGGVASYLPAATALTVASGATLDMNAVATSIGSLSGAGTVTDTGAAAALTLGNLAGSLNSTFSGVFNSTTAANLTVVKNGGGTLTLTGSSGTATGAWTFTAGTVNLDFSQSAAASILNTTIKPTMSGGTLAVLGKSGTAVTQTLGVLTLGAGGSSLVANANGSTSGTTLAVGTLTTSTAGGSLLINAPANTTIKLGTALSTATTINGRIVFTGDSGATYNWAANTAANTATIGLSTYTNQAGNTITSGTSDTVNSLIDSTTASQVTTTSGTWTTNSLKINAGASGQSLSLGGALTLTTGGLLFTGSNAYTISGAGSLTNGTDLIIQDYGSAILTVSAAIGGVALTKAGTGTLVLSNAANTYTGATIIGGGTLQISAPGNLGATATSTLTITDTAALALPGSLGAVSLANVVVLSGGNATLNVGSGTTLNFTQATTAMTGAGGLTITGGGTVNIGGKATTFTGPLTINAGSTLQQGIASVLAAAAGTVTVNGTFDLNNFAANVGGLAGSGTVTDTTSSAARILSVGGNNQSTTFSGTITASAVANAALTKTGTGVLTLSNPVTQPYTGATLINNGFVQMGSGGTGGLGELNAASTITITATGAGITAGLDLNGYTLTTSPVLTLGGSTATSTPVINLNGGTLALSSANGITYSATNNPLGAQINGGTIALSTAATKFVVGNSTSAAADLTVNSTISGAGGITETGAGTLVLNGSLTATGAMTFNGAAAVAGGTYATNINGTVSTGAAQWIAALTATNAVINFNSGSNVTINNILAGDLSGGNGALNILPGASLTMTQAAGDTNLSIGTVAGGYGYLNMSGGTVVTNRFDVSNAGNGVAVISGGTMTVKEYIILGRSGTPAGGSLTITGGTLDHSAGTNPLALGWTSTAGANTLNILGGTVDNGAVQTLAFNGGSANGQTNIANLDGGLLKTSSITKTGTTATSTATLNFNGGTLQATASNPSFLDLTTGQAVAGSAYVNSGGAVIDTNGYFVTIAQPLLTPTGNGVSSLGAPTTQGSGYIGAPLVIITGGGGTGATAIANMVDDGTGSGTFKVAGFTITNPGVGYTSTPTYTLTGGGALTAASTDGVATTAANVSGGLTKLGAGALTLSGANTYTGATTVNAGTLFVSGSLSGTASLTANTNGRIRILSTGSISNVAALNATGGVININGTISTPGAITGVTVSGGGTLNLLNGLGTALPSLTTLNLGSGTGPANLGIEAGTSTGTLTSSTAAVTTGTVNLNVTPIAGFTLGNTYNLLAAPSGLNGATYKVLVGGYTFTSSVTGSLVSVTPISAVTGSFYWNGGLGSSWTTFSGSNTNWTTDLAGTLNAQTTPGSANTVVFSGNGQTGTTLSTTLDANVTVGGLVFNNNNGTGPLSSITIASGTGSNTLTLSPASSANGINLQTGAPASVTISAPVTLGASQTWTVADSGSTLTVSGLISGLAGNNLTLAGQGTFILSSTGNTFGGVGTTVNIQSGTLQFASDNQLGDPANSLTIGTSSSVATVNYTGQTATISRNITLGSQAGSATGETIKVGSGQALTLSGVISGGPAGTLGGNTALTISGGGTLSLTGTNTFTGDIVVSGNSTLFQTTTANLGTGGSTTGNTPKLLTFQSGSTLTIGATINPVANTVALSTYYVFGSSSSSSTTVNTGAGFTMQFDDGGQLNVNGTLNVTGSGILLLGTSYAPTTAIYGGRTLTSGVQTGASINVGGTATLQLQASGSAANGVPITLNAGTTLDLRLNSGGTFGDNVTIAGNVTLKGGRTTAAATNITQTMGTLALGAQTVTVANGNGNTAPAVANISFTSTTLSGSPTFNLNDVNGAGIASLSLGTLNDGGVARTITLTTTTGTPSALAIGGASASTYSGVINVTNGTYLDLVGAGATGTGTVNVTNGTIVYSATGANSGGTVNVGATSGSSSASLALGALDATVLNPFNIINGSSGTTSITTLTTGTLATPNPGGFGMNLGDVGYISAPITSSKTSGTVTFGAAANTGLVITGAVTLNGGGAANTFNAVGPGLLYLLGDKNFTGGINLSGGTLILGPSTNNFTGGITINGGLLGLLGTYSLNGAVSIGALGGGLVYNTGAATTDYSSVLSLTNGGTLLLDIATGLTVNYASSFGSSTTAGLTKSGGGTLNLQPVASETYTGNTTAGAGNLALNFVSGGITSNIISSSSALQMQGGTLTVNGNTNTGAVTQTFASTQLQYGSSTVTLTNGSASSVGLTLGAITRSVAGAAINFSTIPGSSSINIAGTSNNAAGILGGWATYNGTDWAINNGSNLVAPYASYTPLTASGGGTLTTTNFNEAANITLTAAGGASITANSLKISSGTFTLALGANNSLTLNSSNGGILIPSTTTTSTISGTPALATGLGMVTTGTASGGELPIYVNAGATLTISAGVGGVAGTSNGFGITKDGLGTLNLTNTTTNNLNNFNGPTVINGGILKALQPDQLGNGNTSGITLNGGTLFSGSATQAGSFAQPLTLGLAGGTLSYNSTVGTGSGNGGWSSTTPIAFLGSGSRTLTLTGTDTDRIATLVGALGDGGGPTSLIVSGGTSTSAFQLSGANSYSGPTTIQGGFLILNNASALPSLGNLTFSGSGSILAQIEITATSGTSFTRALGTGPGQVQWLGNGGFSAGAGTNTASSVTVNLGGAGAGVTWGSGGFVPDGSILSFNQNSLGAPSLGGVVFQNGIDFGASPSRTIDVENSSYGFNPAGIAASNASYDAQLSGNLVSTAAGAFTKTGTGVLWLTGNNSGFLGTINIANGTVVFANTAALPATLTLSSNTSLTAGAVGGAVLMGATNFNTLYSITSSSAGGELMLDTSSTENINFNAAGFTTTRFGAFGNVTYTGQFTPGTAGAYLFGGVSGNLVANAAGQNRLMLPRTNALTGATSTLNVGSGILLLGGSNNITGAVNIQSVPLAGTNTISGPAFVWLANNNALGTGTITLTNSVTAANQEGYPGLAAAYGDHTLANNIILNDSVGASGNNFFLGGDTATDGVPSSGRMTYSGTVTVQGTSGSGNLQFNQRTTGLTFTGQITSGASSPVFYFNGGGSLIVFNNQSGTASNYTTGTIFMNSAVTFLIGQASDLGDTATARVLSWNSSGAVFGILPTSADVTISSNIKFLANGNAFNQVVDVPLASQTVTLTSGFVQAAARTGQLYTKTGQGTFDIGSGISPFAGASTYGAAGVTVMQGTLRANFGSTGAPTTNIIGMANATPVPAALTLSGGTLTLVGKSSIVNSQAFAALTVSQGASAITLTSNGAALSTTFTTMGTRSAGGTVALTLPATGSTPVTVSAGLVAQNNLLVDAAGTKSPFMVVGTQGTLGGAITDWAEVSGGNTIIALPSYTSTTSSTISGNATVASTVDTTLAANAAADSLRFNLAEARTLNLGGNTLNVGGILVTSAVGANGSTITGGSLSTASGAAANADLVIYQANKSAALTIGANIVDNAGNAVALTKSGAGELVLTGSNTFSGSLFLNEGTVTFNSVSQMGAGASAINLNGAVLHYTGSGDPSNAGTLTNASVTVARPTSLVVDTGASLTLSGTVTSTLLSPTYELLTKTGAGTLVLSGSSSQVLSVDVAQGTLLLNKSGGNVNAVGIFAINVLSNVGLTVEDGALAKLGGDTANGDQILNSSSVQLNGSGMLDLAGHSETIDGLGGSSASVITNSSASGAVLTVGSSSMALGAPTQFDGSLQDGTGSLGLTMIGGNIFTLTNFNPYTGKTTIIGQQYLTSGIYFGGISISSELSLGGNPANFTADQWTLNGGRLVMTDNVTLDASRSNVGITLGAGGGIFEVAGSKTFSIASANVITGTGGFTKEGAGTVLMLGGANTYTGKTVLNLGVLSISAQGALGGNPSTATADQLTFNGGQLVTTATLSLNDANRGVTIQGYGGTLTPALGTTLTLPNTISGTGDLTLNGAGTVVLGGTNTPWTGKTILLGGELQISTNLNLGSPPATAVADQLQISNNAIFHLTDNMTFSANRGVTIGTGGATITTDAGKLVSINGTVTLNAGTLTKAGAGVLTLSGSNSAVSGTQVSVMAGVLRLGSSGALSANSNLNLSGGVVELTSSDFTRALGTGSNQVQFTASSGFGAFGAARNVNLGGAAATVIWNTGSFVPTGSALVLSSTTSDNTVTFQNGIDTNGAVRTVQVVDGSASTDAVLSGTVSDSGSGGGILKTGAGTLAMTGSSTYSGTTEVSGGTLLAGAANVFSSTSAFILDNTTGVALSLNGYNQAIGSLAGGGTTGGNVALGSGVLTTGGNNATTVFDGVISGFSGGLIKTGTGGMSLTNAQTYTGATTINGGALFVNSTLATSGISVGGSGTLGGSGSIAALTTVNAGGTIQAGDVGGNGSLSLGGGLTFLGAGTINVGQIAETAPNVLNVSALTVGSAAGSITINVIANSPSGYANSTPYTLLTYTGGSILGSAGFSAFTLGTIAGTNSRTSGVLNNTGSAITLTLTADNPKWTGASSSLWAPSNSLLLNWSLITSGTPTAYLEGDVVLFDDSASGSKTVNINAGDVNPSSVTFSNSAVDYTLTGSNGIAGTANLNKSGTGTLIINNANSFNGGVILNGGVIQLGNSGALGTTNGLLFGANVAAGTKLQLYSNSITLTGLNTNATPGSAVVENGGASDATLTLNLQTIGGPPSGDATSVFAGILQDGSSGKLGLTMTGNGTLTLSADNTYTGLTTLSGGTLFIGTGGTTGSILGAGGITNNAALVFNRSGAYGYSGNITGSGTTQITGGGALTLTGSLGSTGGTTINATNTLNVGNGGAGGSVSGDILDNGALKFNTNSTGLVVSGSITGAGTLENIAGVTILTGTNNFGSGSSTTITGGTLQIGNGGTTGSITGNILDNGVLAFDRSDNSTFAGNISGSGLVLINMSSPTAVKTLSGSNNYGGGVTVAQGVLALGSATAVPTGSAVIVGASGTSGTLDLNGFNLTISSLATAGTASNQTITNNSSTTNSVLTYSSAASSTFGGLVSNGSSRNISVVVSGGGKLTLASTNTFTGGVTVLNGTIKLGADGALGAGAISLGTTGSNGVLDLNGFSQTVSSLAVGAGAVAGSQIIGNSSTTGDGFLTINGTSTFGGLIQDMLGSGSFHTGLTIASGTTTLTNANTYTGATQINSGAILQLGSGGTTGSLSNGTTITDNGSLSFNRSDNVTFGATVSGSGGLQQVGSGILELNGSNSYSGLTVINNAVGTLKASGTNSSSTGGTTLTAGTLLLNNSGANNGGLAGGTIILGGNGTIDNVYGSALVLSAGNTVTINGSFTFTGSSSLDFGGGTLNNSVIAETITIGGTGTTLAFGPMTNTTGTGINTITVNGTGNTLTLGGYALSNNATSRVDVITGTAIVNITGPVINGGTSTASGLNYQGTSVLTLSGANNYGGLTTQTTTGGTMVFNGSNSGAGGTTLTAGTIKFGSTTNGGIASGTLTLTAGTLQATVAGVSLSNAVTFTAATISGSQSLTFNTGVFSNVSGAVHTLTSSITGGLLSLNGPVLLANSNNSTAGGLTLAGTGNTTIGGSIQDFAGDTFNNNPFSITNTGITTLSGANAYGDLTTMNAAAGTLVLSGSNSGAGGTTLTTGTIQLNSSANGGLASGTLTLTAGTLQALNAARSISNAITLTAVTVSGSQDLTFNGTLTGTGAANRTLTNNIASGHKLTFTSINVSDNASSRTLIITGTGDTAITGAIGNGTATTGGITLSSTGTTTISAAAGTSTYTGTTTAGAGTLVIGAINTLPVANAFVLGTLAAGGAAATLDISGFNQTVGNFTVSSDNVTADQLLLASGRTFTINGNVTIGSSNATLTTTNFTTSGGGTVTVNNAAASGFFTVGGYTGTTAGQGNLATADFSNLSNLGISLNTTSGTIRVNNTGTGNTTNVYSTLILAPVSSLTANILAIGDGGQNNTGTTGVNTLKLGATTNTVNVNTINIGTGTRDFGALLFNGSSGTVTIANSDGSAGAALNIGTGTANTGVVPTPTGNVFDVTGHTATLLFTAVAMGTQPRGQSYTNVFSFDKGTLTMDSLTASTRTGGAFGTTSTINLGSASSTPSDTVIINNGILQLAQTTGTGVAGEAVTGTVNIAGGTVTIGNTAGTAITMAAAVANTTATATVNLTGGTTTINGNILTTGGAGTSSATVSLSGTATLDMAGNSIGTSTQTVAFVAAAGTLKNLGELNGGGALTKTTGGTLVLAGTNTYTGQTVISAGKLSISSETNLGANPSLAAPDQLLLNGGTLLTTATLAIDDSNRGITIGASGGTFETAATTTATVGNVITGGGPLTKEGAGTLLFTAVNTNSGPTTVNNGILGGTGAVGGDLNVHSGGTIAPGIAAEGQLTVGGNFTVSTGGTLLMQLGGATTNDASTVQAQMDSHSGSLAGLAGSVPSAWSTYYVADVFAGDGTTLLHAKTLNDNIMVNGVSAPTIDGTLKIDPTFLNGYTPAYGDVFKLIDWSATGSSIVGTTTFDYTGVVLGGGLSFNTDLFASDGIIVVVPEPSRVLFLLLGLAGLLIRRRRRSVA